MTEPRLASALVELASTEPGLRVGLGYDMKPLRGKEFEACFPEAGAPRRNYSAAARLHTARPACKKMCWWRVRGDDLDEERRGAFPRRAGERGTRATAERANEGWCNGEANRMSGQGTTACGLFPRYLGGRSCLSSTLPTRIEGGES
jgi:hypothetical protein